MVKGDFVNILVYFHLDIRMLGTNSGTCKFWDLDSRSGCTFSQLLDLVQSSNCSGPVFSQACIKEVLCMHALSLSHVQVFVILWIVAHQTLSMEFSRQEYWSGLPFPASGDLLNSGIEPASPVFPALAGGFFTTEPLGKLCRVDAFELGCWRRLLRVPWAEGTSNQSILKKNNPEYSLKGLMLKL